MVTAGGNPQEVFECNFCDWDSYVEQEYNDHMGAHQDEQDDVFSEWDNWAELGDEIRMRDVKDFD